MDIEQFNKLAKQIEGKLDCIDPCYAKKYNKTIFRIGSMDKEGCRTWEQGGKKYICFWDVVLNRYTTAIDPMITYKKARN